MPTTNLGITYLDVAQQQKEVSINNAFDVIDAGVVVKSEANTITGSIKIARTAVSSGSPDPSLWVLQPADTGLTASVEASGVLFDLSSIRQFATGALTTQRAMRILAPTYAFVGASTLTNASTLAISGPPISGTNATITNSWSLNVESGSSLFQGTVTITPLVSSRCMTLNHFPSFGGATLFIAAETGKKRTLINHGSSFQTVTDTAYSNVADYALQSLTTGLAVIACSITDLLTLGSTSATGGAVLGVSSGKAGFYGASPVVKPTVTGSTVNNAAQISLLTALSSLGLVTDSDTGDPTTPAWAWVNQGGASVTNGTRNVFLSAPAGVGDNLRMRTIAVPAAPYTVTIAISPASVLADFLNMGLCLYDSISGKVTTLSISSNAAKLANARAMEVAKWTSVTAFSADYTMTPSLIPAQAFAGGNAYWLQISDDNTNRIYRASSDGVNWVQLFSVGRTDFVTPNQIGIYVDAANSTFGAGMNVLYWAVT